MPKDNGGYVHDVLVKCRRHHCFREGARGEAKGLLEEMGRVGRKVNTIEWNSDWETDCFPKGQTVAAGHAWKRKVMFLEHKKQGAQGEVI